MKKLIKSMVENFPRVAMFYRNARDFMDQNAPQKKTPWGFTFSGHDAMADGSFEPLETNLVRKILSDVDVLVNVGANVGYYCCHALSMGKNVVAIEPNIRNLHYLLMNIKQNDWSDRAEIFPVAMGAEANILEMWGGGTGASLIRGWANIPQSYVTQVPVLSLDRVLGHSLQGKKSLILVDIEGAELMMLEGAQTTLRSEPRPIWLVEITSTEHQPTNSRMNPNLEKTFLQFFNAGYRAFTVSENPIEITKNFVSEIMNGNKIIETYNFLFYKN